MTTPTEPRYDWGEALPTLQDERIALRWLTAQDVSALYAVFRHQEVMRYWSRPAFQSIEQAEQLLQEIHDSFQQRKLFQWGISLRESGDIIGTCTLFNLNRQHQRAEIGYALGRPHWGKGLASEAVGELLRFAFGELRLHRIEADVDPRNENSIKLLERLGFLHEGLLRERYHVGGEIQDSAFFGLLRHRWLKVRAQSQPAAPLG